MRIANVPGITENNDGTDTFGAMAAKFWLQAYQPTLINQHWDLADAGIRARHQNVAGNLANASVDRPPAADLGRVQGEDLPYACGSQVTAGNVAFYGPHSAEPGATISLCLSSGVPAQAYTAPSPSKTKGRPSGGGSLPGGGQPPRHGIQAPRRQPAAAALFGWPVQCSLPC